MLEIRTNNGSVIKEAYAYLRVSSEEQVSNFSLDNQHDYCEREAERQGYKIVNYYREEGVSAKTTNRPQLTKLLFDCGKNKGRISAVFIYKIDRISRETYDYLAIKRLLAKDSIRLISVTELTEDTPTGEFLETLLAASAKLDNAQKGLRTLDGLRKRLEEGWATGRAPVGYLNTTIDDKQVIVPDKEQFELVRRAWDEMATGAYTLLSIAQFMNGLGIKIKIGNRHLPIVRNQQTQRIFRDRFYCGYVVSKQFGIDKLGRHIPMVSEEQFYRVQSILDGRSFTGGVKYRRLHDDFPLRSHVLCDHCGHSLTGYWSKGRTKRYAYYACQLCNQKPRPCINKDVLEKEYINFIKTIEPAKEFVQLFSEMVKEKWLTSQAEITQRHKTVEQELENLYTLRKKLGENHLKGLYNDDVYKEQSEEIERQIIVKKSVSSEAKLEQLDIEVVINFMNNFLWNLGDAWREGSLLQRKKLSGSIFPKGVFYKDGQFRTEEIGLAYKAISQFATTPSSLRVIDGNRTRNSQLHKLVLCR